MTLIRGLAKRREQSPSRYGDNQWDPAVDEALLVILTALFSEVRRRSVMQVQVTMLSNACIGGCVLRTSILSRQIFVR